MRSGWLILCCLVLASPIVAQNLVPNPGFEVYNRCPGSFAISPEEFDIPFWDSPSKGTPDHFHSCSEGEAGVPHNWAGVSMPYEGKGYAGIYVYMETFDYREYLSCRLKEPLVKDSTYLISFRFKLSSYSMYKIDRIGVRLERAVSQADHDAVLTGGATLIYQNDSLSTLQRRGDWELASWEYVASGDEEFLTLGNFSGKTETQRLLIMGRPVQQYMLRNAAYFYIDNVIVTPRFPVPEPPTVAGTYFVPDQIVTDSAYILNAIQFEFDRYDLLETSFAQLDELAGILNNDSRLTLTIDGHTDDQGSVVYNDTLSLNRARSVRDYLVSKGVDVERVQVRAFGKTKPLIPEDSEYARTRNRRVEIRFNRRD